MRLLFSFALNLTPVDTRRWYSSRSLSPRQLSPDQANVRIRTTAYWIAFGPHGPRAQDPPGANWYIFRQVCLWVGASVVVFAVIRYFAREPPKTMSREWQEATNAMVQVGFFFFILGGRLYLLARVLSPWAVTHEFVG